MTDDLGLSHYEPERPVGREGKELFSAAEILPRLDRIGDAIVAAANDPQSRRGLTFLLSGDWGTGKSSALRYVQDYVAEKAGDRTVFVHYRAPLHEGKAGGARASMLLEVIIALQEAVRRGTTPLPADIHEFLYLALHVKERFTEPTHPDPAIRDAVKRLNTERFLAETLNESVTAGHLLEHWLRDFLTVTDAPKLTTVILVDDLDRCRSGEFAKDVVVATNFWSQLDNHFAILAADERMLRNALSKHLIETSDTADGLSKYVHVTVHLPSAISKREHIERLFRGYLERAILPEDRRQVLLEQLRRDGLLEPLTDRCTPRALKERFNALISAVGGAKEFSDSTLRTAVMQIRWPDEYGRRIQPALLGDPAQLAWCRHLVSLARRMERRSHPEADPTDHRAALVDLAARSGLSLDGADPQLAFYLSATPDFWVAEQVDEVAGEPGPLQPAPFSPGEVTKPESGLLKPTALFSQPVTELSVDNELAREVSRLEVAATVGDLALARTVYERVAHLLQNAQDLPYELGPSLGNAALRLERHDVHISLALHAWAHQVAPNHVNIVQNLVEFILDERLSQHYETAEQMLTDVQLHGNESTNYRPHRMPLLRLRLDIALRRRVDPGAYQHLVQNAVAVDSGWSPGELYDLLQTVDDVQLFEFAQAIGAALLRKEEDDQPAQAVSLRGTATVTAVSRSREDEEFAVHTYLFLLRSGLAGGFGDAALSDMLLNLATLLERREPDSEPAGYLTWCGYRLDTDDQVKRLRLIRKYSTTGDSETAKAMLDGTVLVPDQPPATPPFPQPIFPPSDRAKAFIDQFFPEGEYGTPLYPELWSQE